MELLKIKILTKSFITRKTFFWKSVLPLIGLAIVAGGCENEFLDKKPDKALLVPAQLSDFQALLDNTNQMNTTSGLPGIAADDYFINYANQGSFNGIPAIQKNSYTWEKDVYQNSTVSDWNNAYKQIFYANVALDGLEELKPTMADLANFNSLKGSALFYRGLAFYNLSQMFAAPYDENTAQPGIPLRLSSDVNQKSIRGTLGQTYEQIIADISAAAELLPLEALLKTRPSKPAALGLMARVYLIMGKYAEAETAATACLNLKNSLLDYRAIDPASRVPFPDPRQNDGNVEVLYYYARGSLAYFTRGITSVDSALYASYADNDLRKKLYFYPLGNGGVSFLGYLGITTDEVYLIRAECYARSGRTEDALKDLNTLLEKRWRADTYTPMSVQNSGDALQLILTERRKELAGRDLRWSDLRRLNRDPEFAVTLQRSINGQVYFLPPNDNRYVFPIPDYEINTSGIEQNPR